MKDKWEKAQTHHNEHHGSLGGIKINDYAPKPRMAMTIRDEFACRALIGLGPLRWSATSLDTEAVAKAAYAYADAMLETRKK